MARKRYKEQNDESNVDMTPMLDIVFILLIFFIVTTSFIREEGLEINRPKAQKSNINNNNPVILVTITDNGHVSFNGNLVDIERLPARIENFLATNPTNSAVVIPSYDTSHEHVVKVIDKIKTFPGIVVSIGK
ncbi:ExbD/TolR family protein [Colwelliaceae bacterium 6441]